MKKLVRFICALAATATMAGCSSESALSSEISPGARTQAPGVSFVGSPAEKKVGQYVWVWHTGKVGPHTATVEADCPVDYVVTGGGFNVHGMQLGESKPNQAFDGWLVSVTSFLTEYVSITVYASCAPAK